MKKTALYTGIALASAVAVPAAWAGSLTIPNTFTSGTKALASEVNANFSAVKTEVDDNDARITTNAGAIATNKTAIDLNTTHRTGDGSDHANVAANSTAISNNAAAILLNTNHRAGDGSDHANVAANSTAISNNTAAITLNTTHRTGDGSDHANVALNDTHRQGDGSDHANVALNDAHRLGNGSDHSDVAANKAAIAALQGNPAGQPCQGNDASDIMVRVGPLCVDKYEASVWSSSDGTGTQYGVTSDDYTCADNANNCTGTSAIYARSQAGVKPSAYITWFQAQQACTAAGKRLLTNAEWQAAAAGTDKTQCNTPDNTAGTGVVENTDAFANCLSNWGAVNMAGNVHEWVADWMQGTERISHVLAAGTNDSHALSGADDAVDVPYFNNTGNLSAAYDSDVVAGTQRSLGNGGQEIFPAAIQRGGGPGGGGVFTLISTYSPSYTSNVVGFRCAR